MAFLDFTVARLDSVRGGGGSQSSEGSEPDKTDTSICVAIINILHVHCICTFGIPVASTLPGFHSSFPGLRLSNSMGFRFDSRTKAGFFSLSIRFKLVNNRGVIAMVKIICDNTCIYILLLMHLWDARF